MKLSRLMQPFRKRIYQRALTLAPSRQPHLRSIQGFTLLEVLVTALISSVIVSGLLYLTNELLSSDQRESSRTETQRDLQAALDYIGAELQEAVYVYENAACIESDVGALCNKLVTLGQVNPLPPLSGAKAAVPVLAFWKQSPLPEPLLTKCANGSADETVIRCLAGNAYSLVVYAYSENDPNDAANAPWQGEAGIVRYEMGLTETSLSGTDSEYGKYVAPNKETAAEFRAWPPLPETGKPPEIAALGEPQVLVDFVDNFRDDDASGGNGYFGADRKCPANYNASPNKGSAADTFPAPNVAGGVGGFYACVKFTEEDPDAADFPPKYGNQDVIVYLRGNASGRSGLMSEESFLPVLETRQLVRGALNRRYN